ncbi:MAG: hypothetical protein ACM359_03840 [Bacillota bacterium]
MKFKDSLFREPKADQQLSYHHAEAAAKPKRAKAAATHPRSINIGPHTILTIYPDQTAGGEKLIQLPPEAIERFAHEELEAYRKKVAFIEEWLALPKRDYEPYT